MQHSYQTHTGAMAAEASWHTLGCAVGGTTACRETRSGSTDRKSAMRLVLSVRWGRTAPIAPNAFPAACIPSLASLPRPRAPESTRNLADTQRGGTVRDGLVQTAGAQPIASIARSAGAAFASTHPSFLSPFSYALLVSNRTSCHTDFPCVLPPRAVTLYCLTFFQGFLLSKSALQLMLCSFGASAVVA